MPSPQLSQRSPDSPENFQDDVSEVFDLDAIVEDREQDELREVFEFFDSDGSGYIDLKELKQAFQKLGFGHLEDDQIEEVLQDASVSIQGGIPFEDFVLVMKGGGGLSLDNPDRKPGARIKRKKRRVKERVLTSQEQRAIRAAAQQRLLHGRRRTVVPPDGRFSTTVAKTVHQGLFMKQGQSRPRGVDLDNHIGSTVYLQQLKETIDREQLDRPPLRGVHPAAGSTARPHTAPQWQRPCTGPQLALPQRTSYMDAQHGDSTRGRGAFDPSSRPSHSAGHTRGGPLLSRYHQGLALTGPCKAEPHPRLGPHPAVRRRGQIRLPNLPYLESGFAGVAASPTLQVGHSRALDRVQCQLCQKVMHRKELYVHQRCCSACPRISRNTVKERDGRLQQHAHVINAAVLRIQTWYRSLFARQVATLKRQLYVRVAGLLQRWWRALVDRWHFKEIQRRGRFIKYQRVRGHWCYMSCTYAENYFSACAIQKTWRGHQERGRVARMPDAAAVIIMCYRRFKARKELLRRMMKRACCTILVVGRMLRRKKIKWAVGKIQTWFRRNMARWRFYLVGKWFLDRVRGARYIQRWWRNMRWKHAIHGIVHMTKCVVTAQRVWRGKLARLWARETRRIRALKRLKQLADHWRILRIARVMSWLHPKSPLKLKRNIAIAHWNKVRQKPGKVFSLRVDQLLEQERLQECYRIFYLGASFWKDNTLLGRKGEYEWCQLQTILAFSRMKRRLRTLFIAFSCSGVKNTKEAFRLTPVQFVNMLSACGLSSINKRGLVEGIIESCNQAVKRPRNLTVQWREDGGQQDEDEASTLELDEFVEALCRVANYTHMPPKASQAHRVLSLFERFLNDAARLPSRDWGEPDPESLVLAKQHNPELRKIFRHYSEGSEMPEEIAAPTAQKPKGSPKKKLPEPVEDESDPSEEMDCFEFLHLLTECGIASESGDLSLSTSIELFTMVNSEEVEEFLDGTLRDYELLRKMNFGYEEFTDALQKLFMCIPARGRTPAQRLEDTLMRLYKNCPHDELRLGAGRLKLQTRKDEAKAKVEEEANSTSQPQAPQTSSTSHKPLTAQIGSSVAQTAAARGAARRTGLLTSIQLEVMDKVRTELS